MRIPNSRPAWALLTLVGSMSGAYAAGGSSPQQCAAIGEDAERLACYDRIFRAPGGAVPSAAGATSTAAGAAATAAAAPAAKSGVATDAATAVSPAVATPAVPATAVPLDDFGLTEAAKQARIPEDSREKPPESMTGKVAQVSRRPAGELIMTLESGQVWTQLQVDPRARVAVGDTVTIKKAALGSYLLVTANRYATRVRRVK